MTFGGRTAVLALDTCAGATSAAIGRHGEVVARFFLPDARAAAERLAPLVKGLMAEAGVAPVELAAVAVTRGPGTFTGVRIGLGFARGLALAAGCPVLGMTTLELLAAGAAKDVAAADARGRGVLAVIDARRGEVYVQRIAADGSPGEPAAVTPETAAADLVARPALAVGAGARLLRPLLDAHGLADLVRDDLPHGHGQPDAADLIGLAERHLAAGQAGGTPPVPLYLRAPDALPPAPSGIETP
ncbi:tRNA (adenosine(37)-N6)-threonylcarbamoyltransferase complex dimerization subunit type 1 TsaB [Tistrella sp.]|nr:tRNA (adenosine(37)-N6)-threonylcarbamoyltransferase complex dimerization subunit type 1 TsaB [Tistrella sp.]